MKKHLHDQAEHNLPAQQEPLDSTRQITGKSRQPDEGHTGNIHVTAPNQRKHTAYANRKQTATGRYYRHRYRAFIQQPNGIPITKPRAQVACMNIGLRNWHPMRFIRASAAASRHHNLR